MRKLFLFSLLFFLFSCRNQKSEFIEPEPKDSDTFKIIYQVIPIGSIQSPFIQFRDSFGELQNSEEPILNLELYQQGSCDSELYASGTLAKGSSVFLIHRVFKNGTEVYSKTNTYSMNDNGQFYFTWQSQFQAD